MLEGETNRDYSVMCGHNSINPMETVQERPRQ